jgi:porin
MPPRFAHSAFIRSDLMPLRRFLFLSAACCLSLSAKADDAHAPSYSESFLDFRALRARLADDGVRFRIGYTPELAYNAQGGDRHLTRNAEQFMFGLQLDLEKLLGIPTSIFQMVITERDGKNLSADANLGTLQQVQEIYGRGQTWRWTRFWYDGTYLDGGLDVKLGRLGVGEDFMSFSCSFQNLSFCGSLPGNIVSTWYNWPVSQWGSRVKVKFWKQAYVQVGAYQVNPSYLQTSNAFKLNNPSGRIGTLLPAELGWTPKLGSLELPGAYRIGVWYDNSDLPDVHFAADGTSLALRPGLQPLVRHHETGGYAMLRQQVTAVGDNPGRGLTLFANYVTASHETATIDQLINLGVFYAGPFNARPQDDLGFAVGRTRANRRAVDWQMNLSAPGQGGSAFVRGSEYPAELYYSIVVASWLTLRPNVQYVRHPGGLDNGPNVVVLGLKANVTF